MLDGGEDGAWITATALGRRLGLDGRRVERVRQELIGVDLLLAEGRTRRVHWFVRLPEGCYPESSSLRATDEVVLRLAGNLDAHVRARRPGQAKE
jgi:hypothetical protein